MKLTRILFLFFFCFFKSLTASTDVESQEWSSCEKTYVDADQIYFEGNKIFIDFEDNWVRIPAIHVDGQGFYFNSVGQEDQAWFVWRCSKCGKRNEGYLLYCSKCGKERPRS